MKEKYREGYCPGCYFMGRDIVRRAIVQGAIIREGNRPGGQLSVPHLRVNFYMKFADYIFYVAGDYGYNVRNADMGLIVQVVLRGKIRM